MHKDIYSAYEALEAENIRLKSKLSDYKAQIEQLEKQVRKLKKELEKLGNNNKK